MFEVRSKNNVSVLVVVLITAIMLFISGCGSNSSSSEDKGASTTPAPVNSSSQSESTTNNSPAASNDEYPKTIVHAKGTTVIPAQPVRIVTTSFTGADHLLELGIVPVATGALEHMEAFGIYDEALSKANIEDLGVNPSYEKILELQPDLIISFDWEGVDDEKLSQIAPTIVLDSTNNPYFFKRTFLTVAEAVGKTVEAESFINKFTDELEAVRTVMKEKGFEGKTATFISTTQKGYFVYSDKTVSTYYDDLGFKTVPDVNLDQEVSMEGLSKIDSDFIFVGEDYKVKGDTLKQLEQSAVWNSLRAVKEKRVHVMNTAAFGPMVFGQTYGIEEIGAFIRK